MSAASSVENQYLDRYQSQNIEETPGEYHQFEDTDGTRVAGSEDDSLFQELENLSGPESPSGTPSDDELLADWESEYFGDYSQSESNFDGTKALKELADKIQSDDKLPEDEKALLLEELRDLEKQHLEGSIDPMDLEYEVEAMQDKIRSALDEVSTDRRDQARDLGTKLEKYLEKKLGHPRLEDVDLDQVKSEIKALQAQLKEPGADLEAIEQKLDSIDTKLNKAIKTHELKAGITLAASQIPKAGLYWRVTQDLSNLAVDALETGDWSDVSKFLEDNKNAGESNNKRRKRFERRIKRRMKRRGEDKNFRDKLEWEYSHKAVQQFVGTLLYKVAGADDGKLDALLSMIPKDVVRTMIGALEHAEDDYNDTQFVKSDADKQMNGYFGTAAETAERLKRHLDFNPEHYYNSDEGLGLDFDPNEVPPAPEA